ncbi:MAG: CPBP family intramembrane glutamic endopeptidase [Oscillospiraceae bacterium]
MEEIIFRGLAVKTFENKFSVLFTAAAITICFAAKRLSMDIMCSVLLGVVLIFIRYKFGDLKLCMLTHLIINTLSFFKYHVCTAYYDTVKNIGGAIGIAAAAVSLFCMIKFASKPDENAVNSPSAKTN